MSTLGSVRLSRLAAGAAVAGACSLTMLMRTAPVKADSDTSRSSARETVKKIEQREPIPYPTLRRSSSELRSGTSKTVRAGINGERKVTYRITYRDEEEIRRERISSRVAKQPVPEIVAFGGRGRLPSRGYFSGRRVFRMIATGYSASPSDNGGSRSGRTATGLRIGHGVVAVDPHFIPLGTRLYIEKYGYAVAADTGRAIKGNRIDLGHDSNSAANRVGRRSVTVHILD